MDLGEARKSRLKSLAVATWTVDTELRVTSWDAGSLLAAQPTGVLPIALPLAEAFRASGVVAAPVEEHRRALAGLASDFVLTLPGRASLRVNLSPLRGEDGKIIGAVGVALEIAGGAAEDGQAQRDASFERAFSGFLGHAVKHKLDDSLYERLVEAALAMVPTADAGSFWLRDDDGTFRLAASVGVPSGLDPAAPAQSINRVSTGRLPLPLSRNCLI